MYKRIAISSILMLQLVVLVAQETNKVSGYPEGVYATFKDFVIAKPSATNVLFEIKIGNDTISHRFYDKSSGDRLKKEFAFSKDGELYVRVKDMMKNMGPDDKGQLKDDGDYHLKAIVQGPSYIYFEDYFTSSGAALWGGTIGAVASRRLKGLVYDKNSQTFNLFKNAKDFEDFIQEKHPEHLAMLPGNQNGESEKKRKKHIEDIELIRKIISEINSKDNTKIASQS